MFAQEFYQFSATLVGIDSEYHMCPSQRTKDSVWKSIEKGGHRFFRVTTNLKYQWFTTANIHFHAPSSASKLIQQSLACSVWVRLESKFPVRIRSALCVPILGLSEGE